MNEIEFINAAASDELDIKKILRECELHSEDIRIEMLKHFILAKNNNSIIGMIGLEIYGDIGLLRSFCVSPQFRNYRIGKNLLDRFITYSRSIGIKEVFLLTTTAEKYFSNYGFKNIPRNIVPEQIKQTTEFRNICPDSAVCMKIEIYNQH